MTTDLEVQRAVEAYQLGLPRVPVTGRSGELLGRGAGNSLEFQEYRQYLPGDDIRHVDWAAYARSDALMVRMYREEISPRMEILVDMSRSMTSGGPAKPLVARQLASLFAILSARLGGRPAILPLTDHVPVQSLDIDDLERLGQVPFDGKRTIANLLEQNLLALKPQAMRVVISDFLFPHDPAALIRRLASGATVFWVIQLLNEWEAAPTPLGGRRVVDLETGAETDLLLDQAAVDSYLERLGTLQRELVRNCSRVRAPILTLIAERGLSSLCRNQLMSAGLLRAA